MIKVSIIVPVYNTEKYLNKCLNNLINQTLSEIEIICVNDGSTDNSEKILEDFAQKDSRIKILNQENKKQGAARNKGTSVATGEYIGFVDSDDWVDVDYYERLYNAAKKYDYDIALATNVRVGGSKSTKKRLHIDKECGYTNLQDKFDICHQFRNECPTNKIYRLSFLKENHIVWPEGCYCEDKLFTAQAVYYANGVVAVPNVYYYYYRNPKSTVNAQAKHNFLEKNMARKSVLDFLRAKKVKLRDKEYWAVEDVHKFFNITLYNVKSSIYTKRYLLFGCIPVFEKHYI